MSKHGNRAIELAKDSYRSDTRLLDPKNRKTKERYFEIYQAYILTHSTERELAQQYNMTLDYVSSIIKWVVYQTDNTEYDIYFKSTDDKLSHKLQELEILLQKEAVGVKEKIIVHGEMRRVLKLQAQLRRLLSDTVVNIDNRHIDYGEKNVDHRTGAKVIEVDAEQKKIL